DDAGERFGAQPALHTRAPDGLRADDPAVALDPHRAGAGHHGVDVGAQGVKELAVGAVADRPRAPLDAGATVERAGHVQDQVWALAVAARACAPGQREGRDDLARTRGWAGREQP